MWFMQSVGNFPTSDIYINIIVLWARFQSLETLASIELGLNFAIYLNPLGLEEQTGLMLIVVWGCHSWYITVRVTHWRKKQGGAGAHTLNMLTHVMHSYLPTYLPIYLSSM